MSKKSDRRERRRRAASLAGGVAYATIPDAQGVIHACFKANGQLRVVESGRCSSGETALDWNQTGLPGPPGRRALAESLRWSPSSTRTARSRAEPRPRPCARPSACTS
jgi:hypothetical protein